MSRRLGSRFSDSSLIVDGACPPELISSVSIDDDGLEVLIVSSDDESDALTTPVVNDEQFSTSKDNLNTLFNSVGDNAKPSVVSTDCISMEKICASDIAMVSNDPPESARIPCRSVPCDLSAVLEEVLREAISPEAEPREMEPNPKATVSASEGKGEKDDVVQSDEELKIHSCKICDDKFEVRADLWKHYRGHERDKKSMTCVHCNASFHSTVELLIHRKKHEKEGPVHSASNIAPPATNVRRRRRSR